MWDLRVGVDTAQCVVRYDCGVTSMQCCDTRLCVGSYDESVRLFDTRQMRRERSSLKVDGGVWRVKWRHRDVYSAAATATTIAANQQLAQQEQLLVACMHGGFAVLDVGVDDALRCVQRWHAPHVSLAYGADWRCFARATETRQQQQQPIVACCSFYDHLLTLWRPQNSSDDKKY